MADGGDANFLEVVAGQAEKDGGVDFIVGEGLRVTLKA